MLGVRRIYAGLEEKRLVKGRKMEVLRLDKFIANQTGFTRSEVKVLLKKGRVNLNGNVVKSPDLKVNPDTDAVLVDGKKIEYKKHLYIMLNKPAGVICATRDRLSETVLELLPEDLRRQGLFPAGRLDKDTEGFVLITDDGDLAHKMLSPKNHVPKRYFVRLEKDLKGNEDKLFNEGITLEDGTLCKSAGLEHTENKNECFAILHEGMFHQVKRMFEAVDNKVVYLKRVQIGGVELDTSLKSGECRELSDLEKNLIIFNNF